MKGEKSEIIRWLNSQSQIGLLQYEEIARNYYFLFHLFKIVKGRENDVVSSSDETHGSQQLQNKSFGPATTEEDGWDVDADS